MEYVEQVFASNWLTSAGHNLDALESEFAERIGMPSLAVTSGTAALHLGFRLLGVGPGDEVVVPTLTFVAGANPVLYLGGRPVFIDCERKSWNLDPELLSDFLEKRARVKRLPKAVSVVHIFGQSADMDPILEICRQYDLPVLEDAAEALGARYKENRTPGAMSDVGAFSLNGNKIITGSGGGFLASPNREWIEKARFWSTQACDLGQDYLHSEVGYNYRMSNVLAGIARGQFHVLDERVMQRRAVAFRYRDAFADLAGIELMPQAEFGLHSNWLSCFLIDETAFGMSRNDLLEYLQAANIEARPVWKPLHTQKLFAGYEVVGGSVAEELNTRGICLPSSSNLTGEEQSFIVARVREAALVGLAPEKRRANNV